MKCPVCNFNIDDEDYWADGRCLRCALADSGTQNRSMKRRNMFKFNSLEWFGFIVFIVVIFLTWIFHI